MHHYCVKQGMTRCKIMDAKIKCDRNATPSLREKGMEGGHQRYCSLRGDEMPNDENVECLKVNGEYVT